MPYLPTPAATCLSTWLSLSQASQDPYKTSNSPLKCFGISGKPCASTRPTLHALTRPHNVSCAWIASSRSPPQFLLILLYNGRLGHYFPPKRGTITSSTLLTSDHNLLPVFPNFRRLPEGLVTLRQYCLAWINCLINERRASTVTLTYIS